MYPIRWNVVAIDCFKHEIIIIEIVCFARELSDTIQIFTYIQTFT